MKKVATLFGCAALALLAADPSFAQTKKAKPPAKECKPELTATGSSRPTTNLAHGSARTVWKNEVKTMHGEQYQEINFASSVRYRCSESTLGLKRCTITAVPCRVPEEGTAKTK
jgi:hypothetical protein